ncbi:EAL domain-containing response regulator [Metapseudomonas furukawaii]|jgi:EAL domain-containing protein (putative c-di-GMP-specific phosphodiesterase class I)/CheY-like chemotaxis protein|uniref:Probable two-component response regulator n=1 Tax=Metapseudomonas furukawaii TaxID=1149133 RepID=A0AAD1FD34_METFU|nr:EAL domain-containing response regulator [Pseudomonas furukawaii]ELS28019.1 diguanylate cyclase/phosphodiesterase [Pseudomonas furukawaii]BAU72070.1 probable two-component response regulator [Pseudomonas furukawaii]
MKNLSILVLEDEPFQRLVAVTALRELGLGQIHEAAEGAEALDVLATCGGVDIVLCDLRMAGMDGLAFLHHASQGGLARSVILSSGVDPELRQATRALVGCLGLEFLGDLGKPFDMQRARRMIERHAHRQPDAPSTPRQPPTLEDILRGLEQDEFEAWFQPKVHLRSGALAGAEVLARWRHPERGVLLPGQFLPLMESSGLIDRLFWQIFRQGLDLQRELSGRGRRVNLAFNLAPRQLEDREIATRVGQALEQTGLPGEGLTFELTETGLLEAPAASLESLVRLRLMGCGLAMDDFGAGYSSLDRLCELPFSQVKLDSAFVRKLTTQPRTGAIISGAVALAEAMDLSLVVEGVETTEQRERLLAMGCDLAQGFLFARPLDREGFRNLLATERPSQ